MIFGIDSGNTRLKWSGRKLDGNLASGYVLGQDLDDIESHWVDFILPKKCVVANVAGPEVEEKIKTTCQKLWNVEVHIVESTASLCGVTNSYKVPQLLGPDRWANLIAAHSLGIGDAVVVSLGTASTLDMLSDDGTFIGGIIIPGVKMMMKSLDEGTYHLSREIGQVTDFPRSTDDAIETGIATVIIGTIQQLKETMFTYRGKNPKVILTGGHAAQYADIIKGDVLVRSNLTLDGLFIIGEHV